MLSIALFEGARTRIFFPSNNISCLINSLIVEVFPVPGGP